MPHSTWLCVWKAIQFFKKRVWSKNCVNHHKSSRGQEWNIFMRAYGKIHVHQRLILISTNNFHSNSTAFSLTLLCQKRYKIIFSKINIVVERPRFKFCSKNEWFIMTNWRSCGKNIHMHLLLSYFLDGDKMIRGQCARELTWRSHQRPSPLSVVGSYGSTEGHRHVGQPCLCTDCKKKKKQRSRPEAAPWGFAWVCGLERLYHWSKLFPRNYERPPVASYENVMIFFLCC